MKYLLVAFTALVLASPVAAGEASNEDNRSKSFNGQISPSNRGTGRHLGPNAPTISIGPTRTFGPVFGRPGNPEGASSEGSGASSRR